MCDSHKENNQKVSEEEISLATKILEKLVADPVQMFELEEKKRIALMKAAGLLSRPNRDEFDTRRKNAKKAAERKRREREKHARKETGIRSAREASVFVAPKMIGESDLHLKETGELEKPRNCYVCKVEYTKLHHFYDQMCPDCGDFNYAKRFQSADLTGQVAVVTGSRLKIGYHIVLMLLRSGATVVATTRFPVDSAIRYTQEEDYNEWKDRLRIHGLDLRHIPSVEIFCNFIEQQYGRLDILINNAAQTVRRPAGFYAHLMENEEKSREDLSKDVLDLLADHHNSIDELRSLALASTNEKNTQLPVAWHAPEPGIGIRASAKLSQIPYSFDNSLPTKEVFPEEN